MSRVTAVPICWRRDGRALALNDLPIRLEVDGVAKELSLASARGLIADLIDAVERVADVHDVVDADAGNHP